MGANKTDKAIERMTRAAGGLREIDLNFDNKTGIKVKPSSHSHKSSKDNEQQIITDLMNLKPFSSIENVLFRVQIFSEYKLELQSLLHIYPSLQHVLDLVYEHTNTNNIALQNGMMSL